jgi:hypothetical protein
MPTSGTSNLPYGDPYDTDVLNRPLFERFVCDGGWCDIRLLLHLVTKVPPASKSDYDLKYDHPKQWKGFPFPPVDEGTVEVYSEDLPSGKKKLTVNSDKTFAFGEWTTNFAMGFMLRRIEMANYLADLVCCDP